MRIFDSVLAFARNFWRMKSRRSWTLNLEVLMVRSARARIGAEEFALGGDALPDGEIAVGQRMRAAGFAEAVDDGVVVGFEKDQAGGDAAADALVNRREISSGRCLRGHRPRARRAGTRKNRGPDRRISGSDRPADCPRSSSRGLPARAGRSLCRDPLIPVMMTSSELERLLRDRRA